MTNEEISNRIIALYPDAKIDISGEGCSFELTVVSEGFNGKGLLERQKSVMNLFKDDIASGALHALSVKSKTPAEMGS